MKARGPHIELGGSPDRASLAFGPTLVLKGSAS